MTKSIKKSSLFILFSFFLLSFSLYYKPFFYSQLTNISSMLAYPFMAASSYCSATFNNIFANKPESDIENKLKNLKEENAKLLAENIKLTASLEFAQGSDPLRQFQERYKLEKSILAKVAIKNINDDGNYILVNQGSRCGVEKDMVAVYNYQIIGRVIEVFPYHSKIALITDEKSSVSAYTSTSKANGIVQGKNKIDNCKLAYVSHLFKIEPNELVISSGQGLVFPEGFCLGRIKSIKSTDLCHEIEISPLFDLEKIDFCLLLPK